MNTWRSSTQIVTMLFLPMVLLASCTTMGTPAPTNTPAPTATPDPKQALVGSWTSSATKEDILRVVPDFKQEFLCDNAGTYIWKFNADGTFEIDQTALADCPTPANTHSEDSWSIDDHRLIIAKDTPNQEVYEWSVEGDTLVFTHESGDCIPCMATTTANPWKRVK